PRFHLVEVQHLGDHPIEPVSVLVDIAGVLAHLLESEVLASHHLREALNARERRAELVADDRNEIALRSVQPLELGDRGALALEGLGRRDRDAKLLRDGLDEADVIGRPLSGAVDLRERKGAGELTSDADWGRGGCDDVLLDHILGRARIGEPSILADVSHDDRASEPSGEARYGYVLGPDPHGRDAGRVPLVRYGEVILRRAGAYESAGNVEHLRELLHGAAKDLLGIEARPGALRDPVDQRLALRTRLGLLDGERAVYGARDVLPHDHRK